MTFAQNGFAVLTETELTMVNAGDALGVTAILVGTVAFAWSPVVAFFCPPVGIGMALGGLGLIGKGTGAY